MDSHDENVDVIGSFPLTFFVTWGGLFPVIDKNSHQQDVYMCLGSGILIHVRLPLLLGRGISLLGRGQPLELVDLPFWERNRGTGER